MINGVHPMGGEVPSHGSSPLPPQPAPGWLATIVLIAGMLAGPARAFAAPGQVYLVLGSDTAVWNAPGGVQVARYREHFAQDLYTQPDQNGFRVMDPAFRAQFADSFGQSLLSDILSLLERRQHGYRNFYDAVPNRGELPGVP